MGDMADELMDMYGCWEDYDEQTTHILAFQSILIETARAWLIRFPMDKKLMSIECWLPKSQCEIQYTAKTIEIPEWLIEENDLWVLVHA